MSVNVNKLKEEFASLKYQQLLSDKYFIETCFSKVFSSLSNREKLRDLIFNINGLDYDRVYCEKEVVEEVCTTTTTTTRVPIFCKDYIILNKNGNITDVIYTDCFGSLVETTLDPDESMEVCAVEGSVYPTAGLEITETGDCVTTTTTTTTITTTATPICRHYILSSSDGNSAGVDFTDCDGVSTTLFTSGYQVQNFCALENTLHADGNALIQIGSICNPHETTTSTTSTTTSTTTSQPPCVEYLLECNMNNADDIYWTDCEGIFHPGVLQAGDSTTVCAIRNTAGGGTNITVTEIGACGATTTTTTQPLTTTTTTTLPITTTTTTTQPITTTTTTTQPITTTTTTTSGGSVGIAVCIGDGINQACDCSGPNPTVYYSGGTVGAGTFLYSDQAMTAPYILPSGYNNIFYQGTVYTISGFGELSVANQQCTTTTTTAVPACMSYYLYNSAFAGGQPTYTDCSGQTQTASLVQVGDPGVNICAEEGSLSSNPSDYDTLGPC